MDSGLALHPPKMSPSPSEGTVTAQPTPSEHSPSSQNVIRRTAETRPLPPQGLTQPQEMPCHPHLPPRLAAAAQPTQHTHRATMGRSLPAVRSPRSVSIVTGAPASGGRGRHESRSPCLGSHPGCRYLPAPQRGPPKSPPPPVLPRSPRANPTARSSAPTPGCPLATPRTLCREPCPGGWASSRDLSPLSPCEHHSRSAPKNQTTLKGQNLDHHPEKGPCCLKQGPKQILTRALPGEEPTLGVTLRSFEKLLFFKPQLPPRPQLQVTQAAQRVCTAPHRSLGFAQAGRAAGGGGPREQQRCWGPRAKALTPQKRGIKTHKIHPPWGELPIPALPGGWGVEGHAL